MSDPPLWEDVAPYLVHSRQSFELGAKRAEEIAAFLRGTLESSHVDVVLRGDGPGPEYGSCTLFFVALDDAGRPVPSRPDAQIHQGLYIAVSERAPLVTSRGSEFLMERQSWAGGRECPTPHASKSACEIAKSLAKLVADRFGLKYVDADWLRQFKLSPKELPWEDVRASLDLDEPTALNILFDENC